MLRRVNPGLCESDWVLASWLAKLRPLDYWSVGLQQRHEGRDRPTSNAAFNAHPPTAHADDNALARDRQQVYVPAREGTKTRISSSA